MLLGKHFIIVGVLTFWLFSEEVEALTDRVIIEVEATFVTPTCTVSTQPEFSLGSINHLKGVEVHRPLRLDIGCHDGSVKTTLYAQNIGGRLDDTGKKMMLDGIVTSGSPAMLWLVNEGKAITLDGSGNHDTSATFCPGNGMARSCILTPYTQAFPTTPLQKVSATIRFALTYP